MCSSNGDQSGRWISISITMSIHYDIRIDNDIARDAFFEITMGNDVAMDIHCDVTMSKDILMCTY